jgi:hypothetical protein
MKTTIMSIQARSHVAMALHEVVVITHGCTRDVSR